MVNQENHEISHLIGCGQSLSDQQIEIINPETLTKCPSHEVGEIWVSGTSIGQGYWNNSEATEQTFRAYVSDTGEGPFLRTGDLGFLHEGELFVTGRIKDLIIIRGRNLYPQDLELTAESAHPALRAGSGAAFTVEENDEEQLILVQELDFRQKPNLEEVIAAIRQAVTEEFEIQVYGVVLIKPGTIPKTTSGKIQRRACRNGFLSGKLEIISSSLLNFVPENNPNQDELSKSRLKRTELLEIDREKRQSSLEIYLQKQIAQILKISEQKISLKQPISTLGLDSLKVFEFKNQLEIDLEIDLSLTEFFSGINLAQLVSEILIKLNLNPATNLAIKPFPSTDKIPLSFSQQRFWFLDYFEGGSSAYNEAFAIKLEGKVNLNKLNESLQKIVNRHDTLRTSFITLAGEPIQKN